MQRFSSLDPGFGSAGSAFNAGRAHRHLARYARRAVLLFTLTCAAVIVLGFAALAEVRVALC